MQKINDVKESILWDYQSMLPIAKVNNASLQEIAYTSFEAAGKGNWTHNGTVTTAAGVSTIPPTGKKYYNLTAATAISKAELMIGKKYLVSYWRNSTSPYDITGGTAVSNGYITGKTINGWTYHQHVITATATTAAITGTGLIDEVRLYPADALMTTYSYDPLRGMTSQCDANNRITYYDYDPAGRLKVIKDQDGKILKTFDYKYQQ